ncbi:MAG: hypothetical protein U5L76_01190 [Patescibacteria group bacterium]|nr:hypothetical protein [Patescibacteria group bacterium]
MNKTLYILIGVILIVASFYIGYTIKSPTSASQEIQNLKNQITNLQQQNSQLQSNVKELQNQLQNENGSENSQDSNTGAKGNIEYGKGDCMPCVCADEDCTGCPERTYSDFSGDIYFILKSDLDTLGDGDFDNLIESSAKTLVTNGNYEISLAPGEYFVMPRDVYQYDKNFINISSGNMVEKDFKFFKCTSY